MRRFILAATLAAVALSLRPKLKDQHSHTLIDLADVGDSCSDSYTGYGIVDGSLERCENFTSIQMGGRGGQGDRAYEEYKCTHLRAHGQMRSGKCVCKDKWKGPACNDYDGCPAERPSLHSGSCSKSGCAHDGIMAIGSKQLECICKDQWDGRHCERLACWRLTIKGHDKRYRNTKEGKCECGTHYEGESCSVLKSCEKAGKLENGVCVCDEGFGGETCERKCPPGQVTCSTGTIFSALLALSTVFPRFF